jgi:hypothetical protein
MVLPITALLLVPPRWPRWSLMWLMALAIYIGCKWLTWRRTPHRSASLRRQLCYLVFWPGMDAVAFLNPRVQTAKPKIGEWLFALTKFILGFILLYGWAKHYPPADPYWLGWVGMTGIILLLHFGSFHLISCAFRQAIIEAAPLMKWPLTSVRLSDYWGIGWNTAFRDLTHRFLFRPLARRFGAANSLWIGFFVSGLVHDAVISIPARGGYGGPTLFFMIQALGLMIERTQFGRNIGLGAGIRGWLFTMAFLLLPAPLLFHVPFVTRIIVPFMHAIGASPS